MDNLSNNFASTAADISIILFASLGFTVFIIFVYALYSYLLSRIFKKSQIPQWTAWVPIYSTWKILVLGEQPGFWAILSIVPVANIVAAIYLCIAMHRIGKKFGKKDEFVLLAIFLPIVWLLILAFGTSKIRTSKKHVPVNPFQTEKHSNHTLSKTIKP